MANEDRGTIRIELTPDQKQIIKAATSKDAEAIELTLQELEQRIAPTSLTFGGPKITYGQQ